MDIPRHNADSHGQQGHWFRWHHQHLPGHEAGSWLNQETSAEILAQNQHGVLHPQGRDRGGALARRHRFQSILQWQGRPQEWIHPVRYQTLISGIVLITVWQQVQLLSAVRCTHNHHGICQRPLLSYLICNLSWVSLRIISDALICINMH